MAKGTIIVIVVLVLLLGIYYFGSHRIDKYKPQPTPVATTQVIIPTKNKIQTPLELNIYKDIEYAKPDNFSLNLDIYSPKSGGPYPAVVAIHGGGYVGGDKEQLSQTSQDLAKNGLVVFNINYRLAPPGGIWHYPANYEDARAAVLWIRQNGSKYNAKVSKVGAIGGSAGATSSMMLAVSGQKGQDKVDVAVSWSGASTHKLTDFSQINSQTSLSAKEQEQIQHLASYLDCTTTQILTGACPNDRVEGSSPAYQLDSSDSPIYIFNSQNESVPVEEATFMAEELKIVGVPYKIKILKGKRHAQAYEDDALADSVNFLHKYLD